MDYDGKCLRLETAIYDLLPFGLAVTPGKWIYTTDWANSTANYNYALWRTEKATGRSEMFKVLTSQPQGLGYFHDAFEGRAFFTIFEERNFVFRVFFRREKADNSLDRFKA